jgi:hypothetical protein
MQHAGTRPLVRRMQAIDQAPRARQWPTDKTLAKWSISQLTVGLDSMLPATARLLAGRRCSHERVFGFEFCQELVQSGAVESGEILQRASSLVFMFHSHGTSPPCRQSCMTSDAGLDARLLIRTDDVVLATERFALPRASVKVQDTFGLFRELRVALASTPEPCRL